MRRPIPTWTLLDKLDFRLAFMAGKVSRFAPDLGAAVYLLRCRRDELNPRARRLVDRLRAAREVPELLRELDQLDQEIESRLVERAP